ncbi:MAG: hypothetical protein HZA52_00510 [Planctomycetes bacterium]|nr:hypothetical protein [Planctomycetota bacterium]
MRIVTPTLLAPTLLALGLCTFAPGLAVHGSVPAPRTTVHETVPRALALEDSERSALRAASLCAPELGRARAGDVSLHLSDRDLRVIAVAVVITLLIVVIA